MKTLIDKITEDIEKYGVLYQTATKDIKEIYTQYINSIIEDAPQLEQNKLKEYWTKKI